MYKKSNQNLIKIVRNVHNYNHIYQDSWIMSFYIKYYIIKIWIYYFKGKREKKHGIKII